MLKTQYVQYLHLIPHQHDLLAENSLFNDQKNKYTKEGYFLEL